MKKRQEWVRITPAIAQAWLAKEHPDNRAPSKTRVESYTRDMASGRWHDNGETIKFDSEGRLIDGGHRIRAILASGITVEMLVVFNVTNEGIDRGRGRSALDSRRMRGERVTHFYLATVKTLRRIESDDWSAVISDADTYAIEALYPKACRWLREHAQSRPFSATIVGAFAYAAESEYDATLRFYDAVCSGANLAPRSPALNFVRQARASRTAGQAAMRRSAFLALHALRNHIQGIDGDFIKATDDALVFWRKKLGRA